MMLRNACEDLRDEFDLLSTERMNIANRNFLPKYADARENPSRKVFSFFSKNFIILFISIYCSEVFLGKLQNKRPENAIWNICLDSVAGPEAEEIKIWGKSLFCYKWKVWDPNFTNLEKVEHF